MNMNIQKSDSGLSIRLDNVEDTKQVAEVMQHNGGIWDGEMQGWWFAVPNGAVTNAIISEIEQDFRSRKIDCVR